MGTNVISIKNVLKASNCAYYESGMIFLKCTILNNIRFNDEEHDMHSGPCSTSWVGAVYKDYCQMWVVYRIKWMSHE